MKCHLVYVAECLGESASLYLREEARGNITDISELDAAKTWSDLVIYAVRGRSGLSALSRCESAPVNLLYLPDTPEDPDPPDFILKQMPAGANVLVLKTQMDVNFIRTEIHEFLREHFRMQAELDVCLSALYRQQNLQILVDTVYKNLGAPMAISRANGSLCAVSSGYVSEVNFIEENIQSMYVSELLFEQPAFRKRRQRMTASMALTESIVEAESKDGHVLKILFLDQAISHKGEVIAYSSVGSLRPFTQWEKDIVAEFNLLASIVLVNRYQEETDRESGIETLIKEVLTGTLLDPSQMERRVNALALDPKASRVLLLLQSRSSEFPRVKGVIGRYLKEIFQGALVVRNGNDLIAVLESSSSDWFPSEEWYVKLSGFLQTENMLAGVSRAFTDFTGLTQSCLQAEKAIFYGKKMNPQETIYKYNDYMQFHAFEILSSQVNLSQLMDEQLGQLCASSLPQDQELVETLRAWAAYGGNVKLVTDQLHVHRNTLYYRLNKLKDLMGVEDLSKGDILFRILWTLELADYIQAK